MRCGADMKSKVIQINNGYTDIAFKSDCVLYTTNLIIYSPFPPQENEKAFVETTVPNLSNIVDLLVSDIFITHKINITTISQDLQKLNVNIETEKLDLNTLQETLSKISTLKDMSFFDPTDINLDTIHKPSEALKVIAWLTVIAIFLAILALSYCCCPVAIIKLFGAIMTSVFQLISCACVKSFRLVQILFRTIFNRRNNAGHQSPATEENDDIIFQTPDSTQPSGVTRRVNQASTNPNFRRRLDFQNTSQNFQNYSQNTVLRSEPDIFNQLQQSQLQRINALIGQDEASFASTVQQPFADF
jgi:hypothetical protein